MKMLEGTKLYYMFIQAIMQRDPDDALTFQDHASIPERKVITNDLTKRGFQLQEGLFYSTVNFLHRVTARPCEISLSDVNLIDEYADRALAYLDGESDVI